MKKLICVICFLMFSNVLFARSSAYPDNHWKIVKRYSFKAVPILKEGEKAYKSRNILFNGRFVFWVLRNLEQKKDIMLRWDIKTGNAQRFNFQFKRIRALAYDFNRRLLVLRSNKKLHALNPSNMSLIWEKDFEKARFSWLNMFIIGSKLYFAGTKELAVYNFSTLKREKTLSFNVEKKVQRVLPLSNDKLLLWSSYWGRKVKIYSLREARVVQPLRLMLYHHHGIFSSTINQDGLIYIFDLHKKRVAVLKKVSFFYADIYRAEEYKNGIAYRMEAVKQRLKAFFEVKAKQNRSESQVIIALPFKDTYTQKIRNEKVIKGAIYFSDSLGNRYIKVSIPALKQGQSYKKQFYSATITRYKVVFDIKKYFNKRSVQVPKKYQVYLKNHYTYQLNNSLVLSTFKKEFSKHKSIADLIQAIYLYAVKIEGKWDKKNDYVPQILVNQHGGCTEHSRVQIAFLKLAGIPARFNWNYIGKISSKELKFNHKIAEAWLPKIGWFPMEALGGTRFAAGESSNYHFIFAVRDALGNPYFKRRDKLIAYAKNSWRNEKKAPLSTKWVVEEIKD